MKDKREGKKPATGQGMAEKTGLTRRQFVQLAAGAAVTAGAGVAGNALAAPPKPKITLPTITCAPNGTDGQYVIDVTICAPAGGTGLPAGFSVQWMTCEAYEANGNAWYASEDPRLCKASFSGNANQTKYNLAAGQCLTVYAGGLSGAANPNNPDNNPSLGYSSNCTDPLDCDTCYVFRAFGHATSTLMRSDFTGNCATETDACGDPNFHDGELCTRTQGYFGRPFNQDGTPNNNGAYDAIVCALSNLTGGCAPVGPLSFCSVAAIDAFLPAGGTNLQVQTLALTLNVALSAGNCANNCNPTTYPGGLGAAVLCGIVDGVTPLAGASTFPAGSAVLLNGKTVNQVLAEANSVLNGNAPTLGLSGTDLGSLEDLLNNSFDVKGAETCCGGTAFGLTHLCKA